MEITINIPKNNYVQPKEVRQKVVQDICDAFLQDCTYFPFSDGMYRPSTHRVNRGRVYVTFHSDNEGTRFNGAEMKTAFRALIDAGYHMFRVYTYGSWMGYKCSKKPYMKGGNEVFEFNDFID